MAGERRAPQRRVADDRTHAAVREVTVEAVEHRLRLFRGAHELELEERRLADQLDRPLTIRESRQLDDDPILALELNERFGHPKLVDAVGDDLPDPLGRVLGLGGVQSRAVDLEHQVHAAL